LFTADKQLCQGPGALGKALGLNKLHNGIGLQGSIIWTEDAGSSFNNNQIPTNLLWE
jgi:DNA-3-methyladenine glycosylase